MSEPLAPQHGPQPQEVAEEAPATVAARLAFFQRAGGIVTPVITAIVAFLIGGLVVLATHHNPFTAYWQIIQGAGLDWFAHPWVTDTLTHISTYNFVQTLIQTTTLVLTGLAVAFAFRCGLFNIGGQGQYLVGVFCATWIGVSFAHMAGPLHILLAVGAATAAGAIWAGIAGFLKATVGAHEVITTIMLNWIAYWLGTWLFVQGGPLQGKANRALDVPESDQIVHSARLPTIWGNPELQALHIGFFIAIAALVVFWILLNRTTLGYEVRAVGFNPAAAAYGGISVRKNYIRAMAISGAFAGLAGGLDLLGYAYKYSTSAVQASSIGFLGIAVALLGRNTAVGTGLAAFLFGSLLYGTTHGLTGNVITPTLAGHLTEMIEGLVVLFVGADVLILYLWRARRKLRPRRKLAAEPEPEAAS